MAWYFYLAQFVSGLLLANGVPHFVQGISGHRFQSPFASPRGVGESSPVVNVLWGFANLAVGFALLRSFEPQGAEAFAGWIAVGAGVLLAGVAMSRHFGRVRGVSH
ncbi:MAG: hypothetical protein ACLQE9_13135 [Roseiarcus sp.]